MIVIVGVIALVVASIAIAVAIFVGSRARKAVPNGNAVVYRVRAYYATLLIATFVVVLFVTLGHVPYNAYADVKPTKIDVTGRMWSWELKGSKPGAVVVPSGAPVEFDVTSADVNHGFGIYDPQGHLIAQTQAMPGYTNKLRVIFETPGKYHVLCLEYCGLVHQAMFTEFTVQ